MQTRTEFPPLEADDRSRVLAALLLGYDNAQEIVQVTGLERERVDAELQTLATVDGYVEVHGMQRPQRLSLVLDEQQWRNLALTVCDLVTFLTDDWVDALGKGVRNVPYLWETPSIELETGPVTPPIIGKAEGPNAPPIVGKAEGPGSPPS